MTVPERPSVQLASVDGSREYLAPHVRFALEMVKNPADTRAVALCGGDAGVMLPVASSNSTTLVHPPISAQKPMI
jgi:hypothetical protein